MADDAAIMARLDHIGADVTEIKDTVKAMNGRVRQNELQIAILSATCLKFNAIKIGAILGAAIVIVGLIAWAAGVM